MSGKRLLCRPPASIRLGILLLGQMLLVHNTPADVLAKHTIAGFTPGDMWHAHGKPEDVSLQASPDGSVLRLQPTQETLHIPLTTPRFGLTPLAKATHFELHCTLVSGGAVAFNLRFRDPGGEVGQVTTQTLKPGPNVLSWALPDPVDLGNTWGEQRNGILERPLTLHELFLIRSPSPSVAVVHLEKLVSVDTCPAVEAVSLRLETENPVRVVPPGTAAPRVVLENEAEEPIAVDVAVQLHDLFGHTQTTQQATVVPPNGSASVPCPLPERLGIWYVRATITDKASGQQRNLDRSFALMQPAGPTPDKPDGFLFSICTHTERWGLEDQKLEVRAAGLCGAKVIRTGCGWQSLEPREGEWAWDAMDRIVDMYGEQGMEIQVLLGFSTQWAAAPDKQKSANWLDWARTMPRIDAWRTYVRTVASRYRNRIRYWEVWNEPDIGFWLGTLDEYLLLLQAAYEEIKQVDPRLQVMTGGFASYPRNPDFIDGVADRGQQWFDVFAHHRHGDFRGFQQEVDGPIAAIRSRLRPPKPIYFNETAIASVGGQERLQAETLVKKLTFAWARGAIGYTWYDLRNDGFLPNDYEHNYGMITHDFYPKAVYPTYNTLVTVLRGKHFVEQLELGDGRWGFAFADDQETVLVAWNEQGTGTEPTLIAAGGAVTAIDMMGNASTVSMLEGDRAIMAISPTPAFLRIRQSGTVPKVLGAVATLVSCAPGTPGHFAEAVVRVRNPLAADAAITVAWDMTMGERHGEETLAFQTDQQKTITVRLPLTNLPADHPFRTTATVRLIAAGNTFASLTIPIDIAIPIDSTVPGQAPAFDLRQTRNVTSLFEADPNKRDLQWQGENDLSAQAWIGLDKDDLTMTFSVRDDLQSQPFTGADMWQGDSIQVAFEALRQNGFWELGLTRLANGATGTFCWHHPPGTSDPKGGMTATVERLEAEALTAYKARISLTSLGLTRADLQAGIRFSFLVNDNDGEEREGWIALSEGIGRGKDPTKFPFITIK